MHRSTLRIAAATALVLALPAAVHAQTAPAPCLVGGPFADTLAALEAEGWAVLPPGEPVPEPVADRLGWGLVATYVASDTGGATLAELHDIQRRAVAGLARKRDTDATRSRLLTREGPDPGVAPVAGAADTAARGMAAMTITRTTTRPGRVEQVCRVSLDGLAAARAETGFGPATAAAAGEAEITVQPLDPEALSLLAGRPVAVATLIETRTVLSEEDGG